MEAKMERRKQILIGDNDEDLLMRLQVLLKDRGYATTTAWGGRELVKELQSNHFDLILLGDYLPDISKSELWQNLRQYTGGTSVALLETRKPVKEMASQYLGAGGRCVLERSSPYKIVETVCACLNRREDHPLDWADTARVARANAKAAAGADQSFA
jgi:DNA-binding response OmpR family regulator